MSRENRGKRYLIVCVHNSGRGQMAEAFTRHLSNGTVQAESAGTEASQGVNPVVEAMSEIGLGLDAHYPKVIGNGRPGRLRIHHGVLDRRKLSRRLRSLGGQGSRISRRQRNRTRPPHPRPNRGKGEGATGLGLTPTSVIPNAAKRNEESRVLVLQDSPHTQYVLFFSATSATSAVVQRSPTCPQRRPAASPPGSPFPRPPRSDQCPSA